MNLLYLTHLHLKKSLYWFSYTYEMMANIYVRNSHDGMGNLSLVYLKNDKNSFTQLESQFNYCLCSESNYNLHSKVKY